MDPIKLLAPFLITFFIVGPCRFHPYFIPDFILDMIWANFIENIIM